MAELTEKLSKAQGIHECAVDWYTSICSHKLYSNICNFEPQSQGIDHLKFVKKEK